MSGARLTAEFTFSSAVREALFTARRQLFAMGTIGMTRLQSAKASTWHQKLITQLSCQQILRCAGPPSPPVLSVSVDGLETEEAVADQTVTIICKPGDGYPRSSVRLFKDGESIGFSANEEVRRSFAAKAEDNNAVIKCDASTEDGKQTTAEKVLSVKCKHIFLRLFIRVNLS